MNEEKPGMGVADMEAMFAPPCRHKFVFLRQETDRGQASPNINNSYFVAPVVDVFFCEHCLEYRRVAR